MTLLERYNQYYTEELKEGLYSKFSGRAASEKELQAISLRSMCKAFWRKYRMKDNIPVDEILELANWIEKEGRTPLENQPENQNEH